MNDLTTYAIFAPVPATQDKYGRKVRGMLMHVTLAASEEEAFADFDKEVGASGYTIDDHFVEEVPASWLDADYDPYQYPADEIL